MGDWDRKPDEKPSVFFRLKSKDQCIKMRIVASPYREMKVWPEADGGRPVDASQLAEFTPGQWMRIKADPDWRPSEVYYLIGINRENEQPVIFTASPMVYSAVREYAQDREWGDPRGYDVTITRTEKPGSYYDVKASPNKTALTRTEFEAVERLDLKTIIPNARKASEPQLDDVPQGTKQEALPWDAPIYNTPAPERTAPIRSPGEPDVPLTKENIDEIFPVDDGSEPMDLDSIPF